MQATYDRHPKIRAACAAGSNVNMAILEPDLTLALAAQHRPAGFTAASLALHILGVLQGAFVLAKSHGEDIAISRIDHLVRDVDMLFVDDSHTGTPTQARETT